MYFPDKPIIDNNDLKLHEELKRFLEEQKTIDIATGFFNLGGFELIADRIKQVDKCRLLLGKTPHIETDKEHDIIDYIPKKLTESFEEEPFTSEKDTAASKLIDFLKQENVKVKLFKGSFLHGKAYIFPKASIVGSSNFTYSGLGGQSGENSINTELNIVSNQGIDYVRREWFERFWNHETSIDFKDELIEIVENSKFGTKTTPYEVYLKALYELEKNALEYKLSSELEDDSRVDLTKFQEDGVKRVMSRLRRYRGVIVADSVGLGKTWIAKKVIEEFALGRHKAFTVVSPASLREMWKGEMKDLGIAENIISQEELSQQYTSIGDLINRHINRPKSDINLVVVDESHNFRNPTSNRYERLFSMIEQFSEGEDPYLLFLTATPINNSIWDLYWQLMLITRNRNSAFVKDGINDIEEYFRRADKSDTVEVLEPVLNQIMVRRTRQYVQKEYPNEKIDGKPIKFPERKLHTLEYQLDDTYRGLYEEITEVIEEDLNMAYYQIEGYRKDSSSIDEFELGRMQALSGIFRTILLKRLESSVDAFCKSVKSQIDFLQTFKRYLDEENVILEKKAFDKYLKGINEDEAPSIEELVKNDGLKELNPSDYNVENFYPDLEEDIANFKKLYQKINRIDAEEDAKLQTFKEELLELSRKGKIVVFSYYKDTLNYIYEELGSDDEFLQKLDKSLSIVHGDVSVIKRQKRLRRFAPKANAPTNSGDISSRKEIDILFSTDVLSEGQNLQDANMVINYDLHWNPTRMIQRAGRIDRLGTDFDVVDIYNFFPEDELEELLKLVENLQSKIEDINDSVGLDSSVLGEKINPKVFGAIRTMHSGTAEERKDLLDEEEKTQFGGGEVFWRPLKEFIEEKAIEELRGIPDGVRSGLEKGEFHGVFFAFTYEKEDPTQNHYYWYLRDLNNGSWLTNKEEILSYIACRPEEPRKVDESVDIFSLYRDAREKIKSDFETRQQIPVSNSRDRKLIRDITDELNYLLNEYEYNYEDPETVAELEDILTKLDKISHTKRRVKYFRGKYRRYQDGALKEKEFIENLSDFLENKRITDPADFEEFEHDKLKLKAVDVIS